MNYNCDKGFEEKDNYTMNTSDRRTWANLRNILADPTDG